MLVHSSTGGFRRNLAILAILVGGIFAESSHAATVYTTSYSASVFVDAPFKSGTVRVSENITVPVDLFPREWGTLTAVYAEFTNVLGHHEATGLGSPGQFFNLKSRVISRLTARRSENLDYTTPVEGVGFGVINSQSGIDSDYSVPGIPISMLFDEFQNEYENYFYSDSPNQAFFQTLLHFTLSGNNISASGFSTADVSFRVRYEFTETQSYLTAGSPLLVTGTPVPVPPLATLFALVVGAIPSLARRNSKI
ncbi:MAG: hypothetical protein AAF384_08480 [Pseudomonadota bacterium]